MSHYQRILKGSITSLSVSSKHMIFFYFCIVALSEKVLLLVVIHVGVHFHNENILINYNLSE